MLGYVTRKFPQTCEHVFWPGRPGFIARNMRPNLHRTDLGRVFVQCYVLPALKLTLAPENWWLEDCFLLGRPIFRGYVSFRGTLHLCRIQMASNQVSPLRPWVTHQLALKLVFNRKYSKNFYRNITKNVSNISKEHNLIKGHYDLFHTSFHIIPIFHISFQGTSTLFKNKTATRSRQQEQVRSFRNQQGKFHLPEWIVQPDRFFGWTEWGIWVLMWTWNSYPVQVPTWCPVLWNPFEINEIIRVQSNRVPYPTRVCLSLVLFNKLPMFLHVFFHGKSDLTRFSTAFWCIHPTSTHGMY